MKTCKMNAGLVYFVAVVILQSLICTSCSRSTDTISNRVNNPTPPADTSKPVLTTWSCVIDGNNYSGVIDTSFLIITGGGNGPDSTIASTGTSADKKAHIHFKLVMDRRNFPATGVNNTYRSVLVFDTVANQVLLTDEGRNPPFLVTYKLDSISGTNLAISYIGTLKDPKGHTHSIIGKFSCKLFTGDNEPNKFFCLLDSVKRFGYFTSASLNANTLIMEGFDYLDNPDYLFRTFRMLVRTGGTIKPGTYKSSNGDVGFNSVVPPPWNLYSYVDDSLGDMTLTIQSVDGNIVRGTFSGTDETRFRIDTGSFICRVANYAPQQDSQNRWMFGAWIYHAFGDFNCYAGNTTGAVRTTNNGRYSLTINGESDNGASTFKIVLSSNEPIDKGPYFIHSDGYHRLDTVYYKSGAATWDGTVPYLYSHQGTASWGGETYCYIDSIDNSKVFGRLDGIIFNNLEDVIFGPGYSGERKIHKGTFAASF